MTRITATEKNIRIDRMKKAFPVMTSTGTTRITWAGSHQGECNVETMSMTQDEVKMIERITNSMDALVSAENLSSILVGELLARIAATVDSIATSLQDIKKQEKQAI